MWTGLAHPGRKLALRILLGWLGACGGAAAAYPEKPVRMMVGQPGGEPTDLVARIAAPALAEFLGQPFIIESHPGAYGNLASARVARAKPDGYTLLIASSALTASASLSPQGKLEPLRDFAPVSRLASVQHVLVVRASAGVRTLSEFLAAIRANPAAFKFGSAGNGSLSHLAAELLKLRAGPLNTLHVPYRGNAPAIAELVGGHVDALVISMPYAYPAVRSGRVRALAVAGLKRAAALPDVPTLDESGLPGFEASIWNGILVPAGTPYDVVVRLGLAAAHVAAVPVVRERFAALGAEALSDTPDTFAQFLRADLEKWMKVVKAAGITLEQ